MNVNYKIKENGKPTLHISRDESGVTFNQTTGDKFKYTKSNLFIAESKINNPRRKGQRNFVLSVRLDGDCGDYKMSQIKFNEEELPILRDNINKILNEDKKKVIKNELFGIDKKYKFICSKSQSYKEASVGTEFYRKFIGTLINYDSPFTGRFFIINENGALEIIPMQSVIEMTEINE